MRPARRRELAEKAVATKGVGIALACRAFSVSETCFRYSLTRDDENEMIADLLMGLTNVHKTWGFGLCARTPAQREGACLEPHGVIWECLCLLPCVVVDEEEGQ